MYAVVNRLQFQDDVDRTVFVAAQDEVGARMRAFAGFEGFDVVQVSERDVILVIRADSAATLDRLATEVGSPWMREHIVPLLAAPPAREIGEVVASVSP